MRLTRGENLFLTGVCASSRGSASSQAQTAMEHRISWNEPGGGRQQDPWGGGRGGDQGPPDLDEAFRKLQKQLGGLFGGGGGGGRGGAAGFGAKAVALVAGVLLALYAI